VHGMARFRGGVAGIFSRLARSPGRVRVLMYSSTLRPGRHPGFRAIHENLSGPLLCAEGVGLGSIVKELCRSRESPETGS